MTTSRQFRVSGFGFRVSRPGVALLLAVLIVSALLAIGLGVFDIIFGELRITDELSDSFIALSAADQGIERLLYDDLVADSLPGCSGSSPCTYSPVSSFDFGNQRCAKLSLRRTGGGQTTAESIGEYRCGSERSVKRRLVTSYEKAATFGFSPDSTGNLESGLVAYWPLEEASGQRNDVRGSNHLTDNNTVTSNTGIRGNAAQFTAANSEFLSIADNPELGGRDKNFTVAAWVFISTIQTAEIIGQMDGFGDFSWELRTGMDPYILFQVSPDGTSVGAAQINGAYTGAWHFVVGWHDATNDEVGLQVDETVKTEPHSSGVIDNNLEIRVGARSNNVIFMDGLIDEVGYWERVLTTQERADLWNNGNGNTCRTPCQ